MTAKKTHVQVWAEGESFCVRFPNSHTVRLPMRRFTQNGVNVGYEVFMNILREREVSVGPIATKSAPVQHDVDKMVRDFTKPVKKIKPAIEMSEDRRQKIREILRKQGLK